MFTLSGAPSTTSYLDINILSILHYLGSPLGLCTLIFDLMRNLYIYNACTYIFIYIKAVGTCLGWGGGAKTFARKSRATFFGITFQFQRDTILKISIYVISNMH